MPNKQALQNPFPGLRPFQSDEEHLFFGRENQTLELLQILRDNRFVGVIGTSGSGKSSLAFNTIHAEGQRRYLETFNAYARQFLGNMERPEVDKITGLSPVVAIEQKTTSKNPR